MFVVYIKICNMHHCLYSTRYKFLVISVHIIIFLVISSVSQSSDRQINIKYKN